MTSQPFYMISLEEAKQFYQQGCITARGLLLIYLKIKLPVGQGWSLKRSARGLSEELGFSVKTLYKLLKNLPAGFRFWVNPDTEFYFTRESPTGDNQSPTGDNQSPTGDNQSPTGDNQSPTGENRGLKSLSDKASSDPLYSYQIFIKSLSDSEREKFLDFANQRTERLGIANLNDWLAANDKSGQARYLAMWQEFSTAAAPLPGPESPLPGPESEPPESEPEEYCPPPPGFFAQIFQHRGEDNRGSGRRGLGGFSAISDLLGVGLSAGVAAGVAT